MAGKSDVLKRANELLAVSDPKSRVLRTVHFDVIFQAIEEIVRADQPVMIQYFGSFIRKRRAARRGWSNVNRCATQIPASTKMIFRSKVRFDNDDDHGDEQT